MWCTYGGVTGVAGGLGVSRYRSDTGPGKQPGEPTGCAMVWPVKYQNRSYLTRTERSGSPLTTASATLTPERNSGLLIQRRMVSGPVSWEHLWLEQDGHLGYRTWAGLTGILTTDKDTPGDALRSRPNRGRFLRQHSADVVRSRPVGRHPGRRGSLPAPYRRWRLVILDDPGWCHPHISVTGDAPH